MKPILNGKFKIFLIGMCFSLALSSHASADVETLLGEINQKSPEERLKVLTEGAKKEGVAYYYGSSNLNDTQELLKGFTKSYPFVDVRYTRLGGPSVILELRPNIVRAYSMSM